MTKEDFFEYFQEVQSVRLTPESLNDGNFKKSKLVKKEFFGSWQIGSTAGGCGDYNDCKYASTFATNPQFLITYLFIRFWKIPSEKFRGKYAPAKLLERRLVMVLNLFAVLSLYRRHYRRHNRRRDNGPDGYVCDGVLRDAGGGDTDDVPLWEPRLGHLSDITDTGTQRDIAAV